MGRLGTLIVEALTDFLAILGLCIIGVFGSLIIYFLLESIKASIAAGILIVLVGLIGLIGKKFKS